jgi:hypothetical protein
MGEGYINKTGKRKRALVVWWWWWGKMGRVM